MIYLDTSALVKLIVDEAESRALIAYLRPQSMLGTSSLTRAELPRAVRRHDPALLGASRRILTSLTYVELNSAVLDDAGALDPVGLRTLDAIHLASALLLGRSLTALVAYDDRLIEAAALHGIPTARPA